MLAGRHGGAVQLGKGCRKGRQAGGQAVTFEHPGAHGQEHRLDARLARLRGGGAQGFLDRQRGADQGRKLAGDQGQVTRRQAAAKTEAAALRRLAAAHGVHLQRCQLLFAQQLAHLAGAVGFQYTFLLAALGIEGDIFEGGHQSSRVTRSTSSRVVSPSSTLRRPSSRMLGPRLRAWRVSSCSPAPLCTRVRICSSKITSS
ncbi:hypothetical protein D3C84_858520 [compost metagenome]